MDQTKKIKKQIVKTKSKDLLRIDNKYFDNEQHQKESLISNMFLDKKKPNFCEIQKPKFMEDLKSFLPQFKKNTEELLSNQSQLKLNQIDIIEKDEINLNQMLNQDIKIEKSDSNSDSSISMPANVNHFINSDDEIQNDQNVKQDIEMNIYVGVFDTLDKNTSDQEIIIPQKY